MANAVATQYRPLVDYEAEGFYRSDVMRVILRDLPTETSQSESPLTYGEFCIKWGEQLRIMDWEPLSEETIQSLSFAERLGFDLAVACRELSFELVTRLLKMEHSDLDGIDLANLPIVDARKMAALANTVRELKPFPDGSIFPTTAQHWFLSRDYDLENSVPLKEFQLAVDAEDFASRVATSIQKRFSWETFASEKYRPRGGPFLIDQPGMPSLEQIFTAIRRDIRPPEVVAKEAAIGPRLTFRDVFERPDFEALTLREPSARTAAEQVAVDISASINVLGQELVGYFLGCRKTSELLNIDLVGVSEDQAARISVLRRTADEVVAAFDDQTAQAFLKARHSGISHMSRIRTLRDTPDPVEFSLEAAGQLQLILS